MQRDDVNPLEHLKVHIKSDGLFIFLERASKFVFFYAGKEKADFVFCCSRYSSSNLMKILNSV